MNTNYYFTVGSSALEGALDRFSAFFHNPLFSPSCTSRELNAVDSEHKKNHPQDLWRIYQLNKHLSKEGHVWNKFGTGHKDSLTQAAKELKAKGKLETAPLKSEDGSLAASPLPSRLPSPTPSTSSATSEVEADGGAVGRETRRRLVEWWTQEYCASRMHLCIIGPGKSLVDPYIPELTFRGLSDSLDKLAETASRLFSPILNRKQDPVKMITDHPFGVKESGVSLHTSQQSH